jgi:hypothetical protein
MIPSLITYIAFASLAVYCSKAGIMDRHVYDMDLSKIHVFALTGWILELLFVIGTCCVKLSVLFFFRRMVKDVHGRRWRIAIWAGVVFVATPTLVFTFLLAYGFSCMHYIATGSRDGMPDAQVNFCLNIPKSVLASGVLSVTSDAYAILLPWGITRRLRLPVRQKYAMNIVFLLNTIIIMVAATFRTIALLEFHKLRDPTWYT